MKKDNHFKVSSPWLFFISFVFLAIYGFLTLFGVFESSTIRGKSLALMMILCIPLCLYYIPQCMWGYRLDREYFTVCLLCFPVERIPWSKVSEVIYVRLGEEAQKKVGPWQKEFIRVTINPAEPVPFFYFKELKSHWRQNIFLAWNLYFLDPAGELERCVEAFESFGKTVEYRDYN